MSTVGRERVKQATSGRASRTTGGSKSTSVSSALGPVPMEMELRGKKFNVEPLDFNDLCQIEADYGDLDALFSSIDFGPQSRSAQKVRYLFWLILRKADPSLTPEQKANCDYQMTLEQAGRYVPLNFSEITGLVEQVMKQSGLVDEEKKGALTEPEPTGS